MTRLGGKVAVITGAARGIGRATLEVFLAEGARVVATDLDGTTLAEVAGDALTVVGDVSVEDDARAMIEAAVSTYGRIDVLVANAGVIPLSTIDQTSPADWDHVMAADGRGMFLTCTFAIEHMARQGSGSIVLLSSISGQRGQVGQAAYGPAKYVATGLTHHLAVEWASRGIRVNAVAPGTIRTDAVVRLLETPEGRRTSRRSRAATRSAVSGSRARWPRRSSSWPPTPPRSSPAPCCRSTGGTSPSRPVLGLGQSSSAWSSARMLAGWNRPASTTTETSARPIATGSVSPSRKFQARPSWISWASSTGPRAHAALRVSCKPQKTSSAPYAAKNTAVVTPMVTRPGLTLISSSSP
jgi:NAD(P)-dependent dehydrogenase (short-subunit alcohol dehydrogenase family)